MDKTIEQIKTDITMKVLQGSYNSDYIRKLPKNDEIRTFICQLNPYWVYWYAYLVDDLPCDETREACCGRPLWAFNYAVVIDECAREDTREAAYKDPQIKQWYIERFGE